MRKQNKTGRILTGLLKAAGIVIGAAAVLAAGVIIWLTFEEYRPDAEQPLVVAGEGTSGLERGETFSVLSWNIGYGALGDNADFFMDGGKGVKTASHDRVRENMQAIADEIDAHDPDIILLQEVDAGSARSYSEDETVFFAGTMQDRCSTYALNFKVPFVPYPVPPIGKVTSGLYTMVRFQVEEAERIALPCPFSWPVRTANLKRCLSEHRIPVEGGKELVLYNLHLEAYDSGEGKEKQTEMLREILENETAAGNYVIAGGDFNQTFSTADAGRFPQQEGKWQSGQLDASAFSDSWQFLMDEEVPSCRSLDQPYEGADRDAFQYYMIDGFIVSDNIETVSFGAEDLEFRNSDHNPLLAEFRLK